MDIPRAGIPDMSGALSPTEHLRAGLGSLNVSAVGDESGTSPVLVKSARRRLQQSFDSPPSTPSVPPSRSGSLICQSPSQVETTLLFRSVSTDLLRRKEKGRERAGSFVQSCPSQPIHAPKPMSRSFTTLPAFTKSNSAENKENVPVAPQPQQQQPDSPFSSKRRSWRAKSTYLTNSVPSPSAARGVKPLDLSRVLGAEDANHEFPSTDSPDEGASAGNSILAASCSALPFLFHHASTPVTGHSSPSLPVPNEWPPLKHLLPLVINHEHPDLPTISPHTMSELLQGRHLSDYQEWYVIDCRFPYEYTGGHIKGAMNMSQRDMIEEFFFKRSLRGRNVLIIFYCEFSSKRGPSSFKFLREIDRKENFNNYPHLSYPNVYLLEGGYSNFFKSFKDFCDPVGYVQMFDKNFQEELKSEMRATQLSQLTRSRCRSQSFSTLHF